MRRAIWLVVLVVVLAAGGGLAWLWRTGTPSWSVSPSLMFGFCHANDEIGANERAEIDAAASAFMEEFLANPAAAHADMAVAARQTITPEQLTIARAQYLSLGAAAPRQTANTYLMRFATGSRHGEKVACNIHGNPRRPDLVARGGTWRSAVVLMTESIDSGAAERATSVWMDHESGGWRVRGFFFTLSRINGMGVEEFWTRAKSERRAGHGLNASVLYSAAASTLDRGDFLVLSIAPDFISDQHGFAGPPEFLGDPPYPVELDGQRYNIVTMQTHGAREGTFLFIKHQLPGWPDNAAAEAANRQFIDGFNARYPEWRDVFDGLIVRAVRPNSNAAWGTVYFKDRGFRQAAPEPTPGITQVTAQAPPTTTPQAPAAP
ncbi:hypothetical protein [Terricaulis sp.]|uniref:hypothetical protein n=1 Tax=Terricaulis sp. TaxID=2768686 RepID=UPI003784C5C6